MGKIYGREINGINQGNYLNIDKFADHYGNIMQDNKTLNTEQTTISDCVVNKYSEITNL